MSTYLPQTLIPDATMAIVFYLLPPGSQMIYFAKKKSSEGFFSKIMFLHNFSIYCL